MDFVIKTVYLIGANFNDEKEKRGLEYEIEKMMKKNPLENMKKS